MGLSASQCRLLLLTEEKSDLEFRAQQISQKRLLLSQQLESIARDYENATSNRQMKISLYASNADGTQVQKTDQNLTYSALMSGTYANATAAQTAGLVAQQSNDNYVSNNCYRLLDADGAIVVSSTKEIPGFDKANKNETFNYKTNTAVETSIKNVYSLEENGSTNLYIKPQGSFEEQYTKTTGDKDAAVQYMENGIVRYSYEEGGASVAKYYYANTGNEVKNAGQTTVDGKTVFTYTDSNGETKTISNPSWKLATASKNADTKTGATSDIYKTTGGDGKYTVIDANGAITRYVVDSSLAIGSTDAAGNSNGPNYLQDCIRNGKYLIEQGNQNKSTGNFEWHSVSWDSTTNISDSYYMDDDEAAKAKYDRLQTQIQAQDKKLELEQDQVETQYNAVKTEVESVEKVIKDSTESFNWTKNA